MKQFMITYGTLMNHRTLRKGKVVLIKGYKRLYDPITMSYPFILKNRKSKFKAIMYPISDEDLIRADRYEGVPSLYKRIMIKVKDVETKKMYKSYVYYPSKKTIKEMNLKKIDLKKDYWIEWIIKNFKILNIYNLTNNDERKVSLLIS